MLDVKSSGLFELTFGSTIGGGTIICNVGILNGSLWKPLLSGPFKSGSVWKSVQYGTKMVSLFSSEPKNPS